MAHHRSPSDDTVLAQGALSQDSLSQDALSQDTLEDWFRTAPLVPARWRRLYLAVEFLLLFVGLPLLLYTQRHSLSGLIAPTLIVLAGGCSLLLWRDEGFDRARLWGSGRFRQHVARTLRWFVPGAALVTIGLGVVRPDLVMTFPQTYPRVWIVILLTYPFVSVYPQEVIFRAFLFHRYQALFPTLTSKVTVSGLAFGLAHIVFGNWVAPIMTTISGVFFARTYARTDSTLQASLEHGLWGCFAFTVGLGWYVYSGAIG